MPYISANQYDASIRITLYKNHNYSYRLSNLSVSENFGKWSINKDTLILKNGIIPGDIPLTIKYVKDSFRDTTGLIRGFNKGPFLMARNEKGKLFRDADISINTDSVHYSPFFDTTFGKYQEINRIRVDFGNPFYSRWINIQEKKGYKILPIVQMDFSPSEYDTTRLRRYKILDSSLEIIEEKVSEDANTRIK